MNDTPSAGWLDIEQGPPSAPKRRKRTRKSKKARAARKPQVDVRTTASIPREAARRFGEGRIWGCDGSYVFFRPKRMIDGVFTQVANPAAMERHERYLRLGHYQYIETQDDVQIFRVTDKSPFKRQFGSLMEIDTGKLRRVVIMSAVKHEWRTYLDALEELAVRIKGDDRGPLGANQWKEMLAYIQIQISMRGGPTAEQCAFHMQKERIARGDSRERRILLPT